MMLGFACRTCDHMLDAQQQPKPEGCKQDGCAGPIRRLAFPKRKSQIPLHTICFVCGEPPDAMIDLNRVMIGVCKKHLSLLETPIHHERNP